MLSFLSRIGKSLAFDRFPPRLNWAITDICNSKCIFCEVPGGFKGKADCSTEEALRICDEIAALDVREVHLVGGEVFLRKDIWDILQKLWSLGISVTITTNGLPFDRFDEERKELIKKCVKRLRFSLDSVVPDKYDVIRGVKGAYDRISKAIEEWALYSSPKVIVTAVVMKNNIDEIPDIIRWSAQRKVQFVDFQPVSPISIFSNLDAMEKKNELMPADSDMVKLQQKMDEGIALATELGITTALPMFKHYAAAYFSAMNSTSPGIFMEDVVRPFHCFKIYTSAFLDYDGQMRLCPVLKKGVDIKGKPLIDGWRSLEKQRKAIRKKSFPPECAFCFCSLGQNMAYSVMRHPLRNRKILRRLVFPFLGVTRIHPCR